MKPFTLYQADCLKNAKNVRYPNKREIKTLDDLKSINNKDICMGLMKPTRKEANWLESDCLYIDVDNGLTIDEFRRKTEGYSWWLSTSASHQSKVNKDGKPIEPIDKFHVYFPIQKETDKQKYETNLSKLINFYGSDSSNSDCSRLFYGSPNCSVEASDGKYITELLDTIDATPEPSKVEEKKIQKVGYYENKAKNTKEGGRWGLIRELIGEYVRKGKEKSTTFEYAQEINQYFPKPHSADEIQDFVDDLYTDFLNKDAQKSEKEEVILTNFFTSNYTRVTINSKPYLLARELKDPETKEFGTNFLSWHEVEPTIKMHSGSINNPIDYLKRNIKKEYIYTFNPGKPSGVFSAGGKEFFNIFDGFPFKNTAHKNGKSKVFFDFIRTYWAQENPVIYNHIIGWMAHIIQKPEQKTGIYLGVKGLEGTGKTLIFYILSHIIGPDYCLIISDKDKQSKFNSLMENKLLVVWDENDNSKFDKSQWGKIKGEITGEKLTIEKKGIDAYEIKNYINFGATTNNEWLFPTSDSDRRNFGLENSNTDKDIAEDLYNHFFKPSVNIEAFNDLMHELLSFDISSFNIKKIPETTTKSKDRYETLGEQDKKFLDFLFFDKIPHSGTGTDILIASELIESFKLYCGNSSQNAHQYNSTTLGNLFKKYLPITSKRVKQGGKTVVAYSLLKSLDEVKEELRIRYGMED